MGRRIYDCERWESDGKRAFQKLVRKETACEDFTIGKRDTYPASGTDSEMIVGSMELAFLTGWNAAMKRIVK